MFEHFGEYMYSLLTAPMRQVRKSINQFFLFFRVMGLLFDDVKNTIFAMREASMVISTQDAMLPVHAEERGLVRLKGETVENFRLRLELYGQVAETAGTNEGIRYLARSFGYDTVEITPSSDPARWAEATVLFVGGAVVLDDRVLLLQELGRIKPARTVLHLTKEQRYQAPRYLACGQVRGRNTIMRQV